MSSREEMNEQRFVLESNNSRVYACHHATEQEWPVVSPSFHRTINVRQSQNQDCVQSHKEEVSALSFPSSLTFSCSSKPTNSVHTITKKVWVKLPLNMRLSHIITCFLQERTHIPSSVGVLRENLSVVLSPV